MKRTAKLLIAFVILVSLITILSACDDAESDVVFYTNDSLSSYALTEEQEQSARDQYLQINPSCIDQGATIENVKVRKCFGKVNGKIVLSFDWISSENFPLTRVTVAYWPIMISDVPIDDMQDLALYYNGQVYDLKDAFEQKVINHSELVAIAFASWGTEDLQQYIIQ